LLLLIVLLAGAGCRLQDGPLAPTSPDSSLQRLTISCGAPGNTVACEAFAHYSDGTVQTVTAEAAWSLSDATIAGIVRGVVTFARGGAIEIAASYQGIIARTHVSVTQVR
jgi:hypothetical protein